MTLTEDDIEKEGIADLLHTVKENDTKPKLTDQEITGGEGFRQGPRSKLNPPPRKPTTKERKRLTAILLCWLVKYIMNQFIYTFLGKDRRKENGGPAVDNITQVMSRMIGQEYD